MYVLKEEDIKIIRAFPRNVKQQMATG